MWYEEAVFYQIYPLGFCGAPFENDGKLEHRILKVLDWIPHMKKLGINAIYFSPVFESDTHGYKVLLIPDLAPMMTSGKLLMLFIRKESR